MGNLESSNEDAYALDDYESDDGKAGAGNNDGGISAHTRKLLEKAGVIVKDQSADEAVDVGTKIFFCSRTHSQLSQFASEVRKVSIPSALPIENENDNATAHDLAESIRLLSLGSRKNLCINPGVAKLSSATAINERCLELQQPKTAKDQRCAFLPTKETETLVHEFRDLALAEIRDIEDLGRLGKTNAICPYYASRAAIKPSEIVTLPYPLLLQKSAREALGISLKGHVVIIDEAHNLMGAIEGIYSVALTLDQLAEARSQLTTYLQKFRNRLKGKNRVHVAQVVRLLDSLTNCLTSKQSASVKDGVVEMSDLMAGKGVDQLDIHKLCHYLQESKLARKVAGYTTYAAESQANAKLNQKQPERPQVATPVLMVVEGFFYALANPAAEGRFFHEKDDAGQRLRYMLLDPSQHFRDVVEEARAVVLAGGTMSPMEDYLDHLFPYLSPERTKTLSCGHVIPKENLFASPITHYNGVELDFTFAKRSSPAVLDALGQAVLKLATVIPDGLVIFFPSYAYLDQVVQHWKKKRSDSSVLDRLTRSKTVFSESKDANVDKMFVDYAAHISNGSGAVLFAVIGGKLSEGINFSDSLGRGVAVVGLPFPNSQSAEWRAKLEYIEKRAVTRGQTVAEGKNLAREFYENACMRAVNQSIGRAIRHRGDFASIMLLDKRYSTAKIQAKLPGWIKQGMVQGGNEDEAWRMMQIFFATKGR